MIQGLVAEGQLEAVFVVQVRFPVEVFLWNAALKRRAGLRKSRVQIEIDTVGILNLRVFVVAITIAGIEFEPRIGRIRRATVRTLLGDCGTAEQQKQRDNDWDGMMICSATDDVLRTSDSPHCPGVRQPDHG